jgi:hypothetical protein
MPGALHESIGTQMSIKSANTSDFTLPPSQESPFVYNRLPANQRNDMTAGTPFQVSKLVPQDPGQTIISARSSDTKQSYAGMVNSPSFGAEMTANYFFLQQSLQQ